MAVYVVVKRLGLSHAQQPEISALLGPMEGALPLAAGSGERVEAGRPTRRSAVQ
jgi:hypothetical protein